MKKNSFTKIITLIILAIAAFSLVFGSFIMILSPNKEETVDNNTNIESSDETWTIEISADDTTVTIEWEIETGSEIETNENKEIESNE